MTSLLTKYYFISYLFFSSAAIVVFTERKFYYFLNDLPRKMKFSRIGLEHSLERNWWQQCLIMLKFRKIKVSRPVLTYKKASQREIAGKTFFSLSPPPFPSSPNRVKALDVALSLILYVKRVLYNNTVKVSII